MRTRRKLAKLATVFRIAKVTVDAEGPFEGYIPVTIFSWQGDWRKNVLVRNFLSLYYQTVPNISDNLRSAMKLPRGIRTRQVLLKILSLISIHSTEIAVSLISTLQFVDIRPKRTWTLKNIYFTTRKISWPRGFSSLDSCKMDRIADVIETEQRHGRVGFSARDLFSGTRRKKKRQQISYLVNTTQSS